MTARIHDALLILRGGSPEPWPASVRTIGDNAGPVCADSSKPGRQIFPSECENDTPGSKTRSNETFSE